MKLKMKTGESIEVHGLTPSGLPALRLLQHHSPDLTVDGRRLGDVNLNPSFSSSDPLNMDRAQLATLAASNHQLAPAAAPTGEERNR